ncbi:MAG: methyltransferase domain-containing protein [Leifsonia sp.]
MSPESGADDGEAPTSGKEYAERLQTLEDARWRRVLNVQAPYRWNIRRLDLGWTLDVGCGLGRNLAHLDGNGVGVDHNPDSIDIARSRGLTAFTVDGFLASTYAVPESYDSLLFAHVMEHMDRESDLRIIADYLPYLKKGGKVVLITPQERGYASDSTHVQFVDLAGLREIAEASGLVVDRAFSFPFPRAAGKAFTYNEFVQVARKP